MPKTQWIRLSYHLLDSAPDAEAPPLHHPLIAMLTAVQSCGSISGAARQLELSYRHVWGELKRWELELDRPLVLWVKGQSALLSPFGERLLQAERQAQARLAPHIDAVHRELRHAFDRAFDGELI